MELSDCLFYLYVHCARQEWVFWRGLVYIKTREKVKLSEESVIHSLYVDDIYFLTLAPYIDEQPDL